jgi:hypothetical protein
MALIATAALIGCGGGGQEQDSTSSAEQSGQAVAKLDPEQRTRNEEVLEAYEERQAAEAPAPEEQEARQTATDAYQGLDALAKLPYLQSEFNVAVGLRKAERSGALAELCDFMSEAAQQQTIEYAQQSSRLGGQWSCEKANALLIRRANVASEGKGPGKVRVIGVNAQGERATATIQVGSAPATTVPLVKEDGEWKLAGAVGGSR